MTPLLGPSLQEGRWMRRSYALGVTTAACIGYFLYRIPIQVFDCFTDMLSLLNSMEYLVRDAFNLPSYLRPGRWVFQKAVFELSQGDYFAGFRTTQVVQTLAVIVLFIRLLQPRTPQAFLVLPLGLAMLVGSHTFLWTVREAYPINHFLTILLCCVAAANVAFARHRWWTDLLVAALFVAAAGTLESGLLVWVIAVGTYLVGGRGVSARGLVGLTLLLVGYFYVRFVVFDVGTPGLELREAGFGFERHTGEALARRFSANPAVFYAYNVAAAALGVLFAEPRDGVWSLVRGIVRHDLHPASVVNVVSSTIATVLIIRFAWRRRGAWRARELDRRDQLVLLFVVVLSANAAMCYAYTKDVIMSPAGLFFAAAAFVACVDVVELSAGGGRPRAAAAGVLLLVLSAGWAFRVVGLHAALDKQAYDVRQQWSLIDEWVPRWRANLTPDEAALERHLQDDAVGRQPGRMRIREKWTRLLEIE